MINHPDLFIKKWRCFHHSFRFSELQEFFKNNDLNIFSVCIFILIAIFLPFKRADLTASASLQGIRSEGPRLHALCLASAATSARE
jgi:hypothetical protein